MHTRRSESDLQDSLAAVQRLLDRHRVLEALVRRQEGLRRDLLEQLQHRQNLAELHNKLRGLHPADVAFILEALPPEERLVVWHEVAPERRGLVLVEVSAAVRQPLIDAVARDDLVAALETLDAEDLAYLADDLPADVLRDVSRALDAGEQGRLQSSISWPEDSVGHLMSYEVVAIRDVHTVAAALAELRARGELPDHTDRLFVVDARNLLQGAVAIAALLVASPDQPVTALLLPDLLTFAPDEAAESAARAFERYDLVSAPVVDDRGKLIGRVTVDAVLDFIREDTDRQALKRAGLRGDEDLFAPAWDSARNRWPWLFVNLVTAFVASRVIGLFEHAIQQLVALATLMPIVASVGGNTGNQTVALVIRALALDQVNPSNSGRLVRKELTVSLLNGLMWGGVMGVCAWALYGSLPLGLVMMGAVLLNLVVAALMGIGVPLGLHLTGRDPAQGASVLLTFLTDSMGFFLFLGLASAFLT